MQTLLPVQYKSSASTMIYRDGGSLELTFIADDDKNYSIFMELVQDSPADCKRYSPPMLFNGSVDLNNVQSEDLISYLTWQQIVVLLEAIKADIGKDDKKGFYSSYFDLVEKIANSDGWLIK